VKAVDLTFDDPLSVSHFDRQHFDPIGRDPASNLSTLLRQLLVQLFSTPQQRVVDAAAVTPDA